MQCLKLWLPSQVQQSHVVRSSSQHARQQHACTPTPAASLGEACHEVHLTATCSATCRHTLVPALQAFMGEVAMWTGIVTGTFMFASPILFDRLGWQGVASVTPRFMLWAGMPFFAGISLYALWPARSGFGAVATLRILVLGGAMLQVSACCAVPFSLRRGAAFAGSSPYTTCCWESRAPCSRRHGCSWSPEACMVLYPVAVISLTELASCWSASADLGG